MNEPRTPKEAIYGNQISPLMTIIIELCNEHRINFVADFSLGYDPAADETLFCTTALPNIDKADQKGCERMMRSYRAMKPHPELFAFTITSGKKQ